MTASDPRPLSPTDEETEAWKRLGFSADAALAHRYLRRILETVIDIPEAGALLAHNGRRSLARDLMRLMAEGIEARGRTDTDHSGGTSSGGDAILAGQSKPVASRPSGGPGRRVNADTIVPGWNSPRGPGR